MVENIFDTPSVSQSPPKPAISSIIIRSADPDSVLAQLPLDLRQRAKVYQISPETRERSNLQKKDRYHKDNHFREQRKKQDLARKNQKYADDVLYREKRAQQGRQYRERRKQRDAALVSTALPLSE